MTHPNTRHEHPTPEFIKDRIMAKLEADMRANPLGSGLPFIPTRAVRLVEEAFRQANADWDNGEEY